MAVLLLQALLLLALIGSLVLWLVYFPYPSPLVRRWLPPRKRWPERQIRGWLETARFHPAYLAHYYRDPERFPDSENGLLAPADGLVTGADVRDGVRYLVIALSFWDMHVQRSPLEGRVVCVESFGDIYTDGEGKKFAFLRNKHCPVQKRIALDTAAGRLAVRLVTSVASRRIQVLVKSAETISRGQRIGKILLGSTVVLELPADMYVRTRVGERVRAGETLVAEHLSSS